MTIKPDYSLLDQQHILQTVFYPRKEWYTLPAGAWDHLVPVAGDISISCRFYPAGNGSSPSFLFFHGNGEVACDYDDIALLYKSIGISLFVADYRGYGQSGGTPSFSCMVSDAHVIFDYFRNLLAKSKNNGRVFVMGRSLGSLSAAELSASYPENLNGLIIESGFASSIRLLHYLGSGLSEPHVVEFEASSLEKINSINVPLLIIHGEHDSIIPIEQAYSFYESAGSKDKRLVSIPGAGHNDLMLLGMDRYFSAISEFVEKH